MHFAIEVGDHLIKIHPLFPFDLSDSRDTHIFLFFSKKNPLEILSFCLSDYSLACNHCSCLDVLYFIQIKLKLYLSTLNDESSFSIFILSLKYFYICLAFAFDICLQ